MSPLQTVLPYSACKQPARQLIPQASCTSCRRRRQALSVALEEFLSPSLGQVPQVSLGGVPGQACVVSLQYINLSRFCDHSYATPTAILVLRVLPVSQAQSVAVEGS